MRRRSNYKSKPESIESVFVDRKSKIENQEWKIADHQVSTQSWSPTTRNRTAGRSQMINLTQDIDIRKSYKSQIKCQMP